MPALQSVLNEASNPLDQIEELAMTNEWMVERDGDDEVNMIVEGGWTDMHLCINWHRELEGLHLACTFDLKIPPARREEVSRLAALINEQLYFGHYDVWRREGVVLFRNGLLLSGGAEATVSQCESLIRLALESCERYFPAFQFVIWAGKSAEDALQSSLLETVGEA
ncbi:MAG: YbjN domain-containing protein [Hyphomicrobiales bacterium]